MSRLKKLAEELNRRSLWQVLLVYVGVSYAILEAVDLFADRLGLPDRFFLVAFILLIVGLPVIVTTAVVQRGGSPSGAVESAEQTVVVRRGVRRFFTWRNVLVGVTAAFVMWGIVAAGWLLITGKKERAREAVDLVAEPTLDRNRIAVLYFDDHSEGRVNLHLADAFTEALTHELSQVPGLDVLPRSAVKPYRGSAVPPDSIARALNAGTLVEGSVLGHGGSLQVTAQPIDAHTMKHLTSIVVKGRRDQPLAVLEALARDVSNELRQSLGTEIRLRERMAGTDSDEAWELVHRAARQRAVADELSTGGVIDAADEAYQVADSLLALAEALDRDWVEPIVARGWLEARRAVNRRPDPRSYDIERTLAGIAHADRAVQLAPGDPSALELRGVLMTYLVASSADTDSLRREAERDLRAAVIADTTRAIAYSRLSRLLRESGRFAEAKLFAAKAYRADPYLESAIVVLARLCETSVELKDFEEAYYWCREGRRRFPKRASFMSGELLLLASVAPKPEPDTVWQIALNLLNALPERQRLQQEPEVLMDVAASLARAGLTDSARAVIRRARSLEYGSRSEVDYREAHARLQLGEPDEALRLLRRYLEAEPGWRDYIAEDWWWEPLHGDPRFREMVGEVQ